MPGSFNDRPPQISSEEQSIKTMQEMFPHYTRFPNKGVETYRIQYLDGPKLIGLPKYANKTDNKNTVIPAGTHHYRSMKWYLSRLRWEAPGPHHRGTTNAELALDYEAATGVPLADTHSAQGRTLQEKAITFAATAKTVAKLCGRQVSPGSSTNKVAALAPFKLPHLRGHEYRARLLRPIEVAMAIGTQQAIKMAPETTIAAMNFVPKWVIKPGKPDWQHPKELTSSNNNQTTKLKITAAMMSEHGKTPNCEGCQAPKTTREKRNYKPHTQECQDRFKQIKQNKIKEPERQKQRTGMVTDDRLQEHNRKEQEDRHQVKLVKDKKVLVCQKCDAIAPTTMVMAFLIEDCLEITQTFNITSRRGKNSTWYA